MSIAKYVLQKVAYIFVVQTACYLLCCLMYRVNMSGLKKHVLQKVADIFASM